MTVPVTIMQPEPLASMFAYGVAPARSIIESSLISSVDVLGSVRSQFELTA